METLKRTLTLLVLFEILISADSRAQAHRLLVLSPRVGPVIDSTEREYFDLFSTIRHFHLASVYQSPGDTFLVAAKRTIGHNALPDTVFSIPLSLLELYAERIEHRESLLRGAYVPGSRPSTITYEDGSPLHSYDIVRTDGLKALRPAGNDGVAVFPGGRIPLAQNSAGLNRPMFHTTHFAFSIGGLFTDFSSLSSLNAEVSNFCAPLAFYIEVPLAEDPLISVVGGWGFALGGTSGGSLLTCSTALLYRTGTDAFSLIVGIGAARTSYSNLYISSGNNYSSNTNIDIEAASTYSMLIAGLCLIPNRIDLLCFLPLGSDLHTVFEKRSYTISPAVFEVRFVVSL